MEVNMCLSSTVVESEINQHNIDHVDILLKMI